MKRSRLVCLLGALACMILSAYGCDTSTNAKSATSSAKSVNISSQTVHAAASASTGSQKMSGSTASGSGSDKLVMTDDADGEELLQVQIDRVKLPDDLSDDARKVIEEYYSNLYASEQTWWEDDLAEFAKQNKQSAADTGDVFAAYTIAESYSIMCDDRTFLSVKRSSEINTGGSHGNESISCDTFWKETGNPVSLDEIFETNDWKSVLIDVVCAQIAERKKMELSEDQQYYGDVEELAEQTFDEKAFYLTEDHRALVLVYQTYSLAPYAAGTQYFEIPLCDLSDIVSKAIKE